MGATAISNRKCVSEGDKDDGKERKINKFSLCHIFCEGISISLTYEKRVMEV